jgi:protein-tyrosine phosphatase
MSGILWFGGTAIDAEERGALFAELDSNGVKVVWNLQELLETVAEERAHFKAVIWTPIPRSGVPSDRQGFLRDLDRILALLHGGTGVYVHGATGSDRTALVLAALLARLGVPAREALEQIQQVVGQTSSAERGAFVESIEPAAPWSAVT